MPTRPFLSAAYYSIWVLFLVGFVAFGWQGAWSRSRSLVPLRATPYASTDAFLSAILKVESGSERIRATLDQLPADQPVIFVYPRNDYRWGFVCHAVTYLAWPRRIQGRPMDPNQIGDGGPLATDSHDAAIFCDIDLPIRYRSRFRIGQHLVIASVIGQNE